MSDICPKCHLQHLHTLSADIYYRNHISQTHLHPPKWNTCPVSIMHSYSLKGLVGSYCINVTIGIFFRKCWQINRQKMQLLYIQRTAKIMHFWFFITSFVCVLFWHSTHIHSFCLGESRAFLTNNALLFNKDSLYTHIHMIISSRQNRQANIFNKEYAQLSDTKFILRFIWSNLKSLKGISSRKRVYFWNISIYLTRISLDI